MEDFTTEELEEMERTMKRRIDETRIRSDKYRLRVDIHYRFQQMLKDREPRKRLRP